MVSANATQHDEWGLRSVPLETAAHYRSAGWWLGRSLGDIVAEGLSSMGTAGFQVHSALRPWSGTFAEVDQAARRLASALSARGVGAGDVVVIQLPNWMEAGVAFWAATYLGAVVVPVVHFYGSRELEHIVATTRPSVVIGAERFGSLDTLGTQSEVLERHDVDTWLVVGADGPLPEGAIAFETMLDADPLSQHVSVDPSSPALIGFTSGTTQHPKGVVHSHDTLGFESRQLAEQFPEGGPPQITGAPVGHFIGMLNAFMTPMFEWRPVNLVDVWNPDEILRLMAEEGLGLTGGATYFLTSILDHPNFGPEHLAMMPFAGLGGSPVPDAVTERAEAMGIKVFRAYGSTEHPSSTAARIDEPADKRMHTDGHALPGVELMLDADGEILSRGADCFIGYTDPALTAAAFDDDGWYHTGDIGRMDDEGYLTITDRVSDVIIRGGENISAREVEELVATMDGVAEVAVVAAPDERFGERAAAVLRLLPEASAPKLEQIRAHLADEGLAKQKWPESVHVVAELPRTASGKVQKFALRQSLRDGELEPLDS